jgi:hypothetical protein
LPLGPSAMKPGKRTHSARTNSVNSDHWVCLAACLPGSLFAWQSVCLAAHLRRHPGSACTSLGPIEMLVCFLRLNWVYLWVLYAGNINNNSALWSTFVNNIYEKITKWKSNSENKRKCLFSWKKLSWDRFDVSQTMWSGPQVILNHKKWNGPRDVVVVCCSWSYGFGGVVAVLLIIIPPMEAIFHWGHLPLSLAIANLLFCLFLWCKLSHKAYSWILNKKRCK